VEIRRTSAMGFDPMNKRHACRARGIVNLKDGEILQRGFESSKLSSGRPLVSFSEKWRCF
jgi:hypothetical protein